MTKPRRSSAAALLGCGCLLATACVPSLKGNDPREAKKEVPASFGPGQAGSGDSAAAAPSSGNKNWNDFFTSAELRSLVDTALKNNQELNIRLQEIIIAQTEVSARKGEYLPKLSAGVGAGVEKVGRTTRNGTVDEAFDLPEHMGDFAFGLRGSWEIDIWKKLRNSAKAANYRFLSSIEGKNFMVTQLVAEIARSYYELTALDNQLDVLKRNIAIQTDALEVVKLEKLAARVTELAVQRFEAEVLKNKSRLYNLEQQRVQAENRINFLVGRFPQRIERDSQKFQEPLPQVLAAGIPSQLLENRPDVRQAELDLEASKLDVKAAKAGFFPALSIDAGVGYNSFRLDHLVTTPESFIYNVAGNLTAPLLNRAAISAQYRSANARQLQAVFNYERTILQAFTDVANQVAMIDNLKKSYELQQQQVDKLIQASEISTILFRSARADYMEVLLTRRDKLDAELELIETKKQQLQTMVNMYQALGGGWRSADPKAAGSEPKSASSEPKSAAVEAKPTESSTASPPQDAAAVVSQPAATEPNGTVAVKPAATDAPPPDTQLPATGSKPPATDAKPAMDAQPAVEDKPKP
jgi:outer membrane protein, multidrug efflux system